MPPLGPVFRSCSGSSQVQLVEWKCCHGHRVVVPRHSQRRHASIPVQASIRRQRRRLAVGPAFPPCRIREERAHHAIQTVGAFGDKTCKTPFHFRVQVSADVHIFFWAMCCVPGGRAEYIATAQLLEQPTWPSCSSRGPPLFYLQLRWCKAKLAKCPGALPQPHHTSAPYREHMLQRRSVLPLVGICRLLPGTAVGTCLASG